MSVRFFLVVNKQGQTKLSRYYSLKEQEETPLNKRVTLEGEISRKCLKRKENECSFFEMNNNMIVYRRYASLFFIVGCDPQENELGMMEFVHCVVETLDYHFQSICELDVMFNIEKLHFVLDEMIANGHIVEHAKIKIVEPLQMLQL
eukprot:TRINITY_DN5150_c0_g1_i1.p1 TRINITY_DN5150_c0_g1~~TRINITY_DN5150_c0_g1_i1.p1  ORF type:complete len:147 (-),score=37.82 TRINITY_DN5150_c0_g1_i1:229-669(-)